MYVKSNNRKYMHIAWNMYILWYFDISLYIGSYRTVALRKKNFLTDRRATVPPIVKTSASGDITRQGFRVTSGLIFWYVLEAMWCMYNVDLSDHYVAFVTKIINN